jgi:hypothetical protein
MSGRIDRVAAAAVLALVLVVTTAGAALAKPLSESKWRKQGNAICKQFHADRQAILPASGGSIFATKNATAARQYVDQVVPLYEGLIASLDALAEPKARVKAVKTFLASLTEAVAAIQADPVAAFAVFDNPFEDTYAAAAKLDLASCAGLADQRI